MIQMFNDKSYCFDSKTVHIPSDHDYQNALAYAVLDNPDFYTTMSYEETCRNEKNTQDIKNADDWDTFLAQVNQEMS